MLQVSNLSVQFGGNYLFDDVSFVVNKGDRIGLTGRNGAGKSTLLKIIAGEIPSESGDIITPKEYTIGYLPQQIQIDSKLSIVEEAESALQLIKLIEEELEELNEELINREDYDSKEYMSIVNKVSNLNERLEYLGAVNKDAEIERVLLGLGFLKKDFTKKMSEFSGGWQMRVELAKLLLRKPDCILLDEPTNHLDIESIGWIEQFMRNYDGAILLVSHDRRFLDNITNRTIEISLGRIYDMPYKYSDFVIKRKEIKEQQVAAFENQQKKIAQTERFIERFRSKNTLATRVQSKIKQLEKLDRIEIDQEDVKAMNIRFPEPPRSGRLVAETRNLYKSFGNNHVLRGIDFYLERGEKVAFVGKNGEGKSTFSKIIAGVLDYEGELSLGSNVYLSYFAQNQAHELYDNYTVFEVIDKAASGDMRAQVRNLLGAFLFSGDAVNKKVKVLSGGEKSRLAIAKLLLDPINLLILDEPTNHLDMIAKDVLKDALTNYKGAMIVVSHDREFLEGLTNKTIEFKNGKIIEYQGDINYFIEKKGLNDLNSLDEKNKKGGNKNNDKTQSAKVERELQKEFQRNKRKLEKEVSQCEETISKLEQEISSYENQFSDPKFFEDQDKASEIQNLYDKSKKELEITMEKWTESSSKLEELIGDGK